MNAAVEFVWCGVQPNYSVEVVLFCVAVGVVTKSDKQLQSY